MADFRPSLRGTPSNRRALALRILVKPLNQQTLCFWNGHNYCRFPGWYPWGTLAGRTDRLHQGYHRIPVPTRFELTDPKLGMNST